MIYIYVLVTIDIDNLICDNNERIQLYYNASHIHYRSKALKRS